MKKYLFIFSCLMILCYQGYSQNTGIGTVIPATKLHISDGSSGVTPFTSTILTVESNAHTYVSLLSPAANESGILFGLPSSAASGGIIYNNAATLNGLQFRTNGNNTRVVILNDGKVGIGITVPSEKLQVAGNVKANDFVYNVPKVSYVNLTGSDFVPQSSYDTLLTSVGTGGARLVSSIPGKSFFAGVHIPNGASITKMTAYINDNSASDNLQITLWRKDIVSNFFPDNIGVVTSSGNPLATTGYSYDIFLENLVDNTTYTYYVTASNQSFSTPSYGDMDLISVVFEYTMPSPN